MNLLCRVGAVCFVVLSGAQSCDEIHLYRDFLPGQMLTIVAGGIAGYCLNDILDDLDNLEGTVSVPSFFDIIGAAVGVGAIVWQYTYKNRLPNANKSTDFL